MSKLIVEICSIKSVDEHPNADRLEVLTIKGWQVVAQKGMKVGDLVVFIPPDAILPESLHDFLAITKYCAELPKKPDGTRPTQRRVKAARLRGIPSYGTIMTLDSFCEHVAKSAFCSVKTPEEWGLVEGLDVCENLHITKWEPPVKCNAGDAEHEHHHFPPYTNIENWANYPNVFEDDEVVIITEKVHGCLRKDSLITMFDGSKMYEKPISDINTGEIVKTYDIKKGMYTTAKVNGVLVQDVTDKLDWFELEFDNGRKLVCTEDHPLLTTDGWIKAKDLTENHILL